VGKGERKSFKGSGPGSENRPTGEQRRLQRPNLQPLDDLVEREGEGWEGKEGVGTSFSTLVYNKIQICKKRAGMQKGFRVEMNRKRDPKERGERKKGRDQANCCGATASVDKLYARKSRGWDRIASRKRKMLGA